MKGLITFITKNNEVELTVKDDYLKELEVAPEELTLEEHAQKYNFADFLHNPNGPAIKHVSLKGKADDIYALDGRPLSPEDEEDNQKILDIKKKQNFNSKLDEALQ